MPCVFLFPILSLKEALSLLALSARIRSFSLSPVRAGGDESVGGARAEAAWL
jgi:hypothetical protein